MPTSFEERGPFERQTSTGRSFLSNSIASFTDCLEDAAVARSLARSQGEASKGSILSTDTGAASWSRAGFLIANLIVGSGIFTTPYGFVDAGWFAIPLAVVAVLVATWTALLLGDLLEVVDAPECPPTYNVIGERAFGRAFLPLFGLFGLGQCLLQGVYMIVLSAQSWQASVGLDVQTMIFANAGVCFIITIVPRRYFSIIAKIGVAITLSAIAVCVASGLVLIPNEVNTDQSLFGRGLAGVAGSLSAVILSCGDHVCFPDTYLATGRKKSSYKKGAVMGFAIFLTCVLIFCIPCYITLGAGIKPNALTNIGRDGWGNPTSFPSWLSVTTNAVLAFRFLFIIPCFMPTILVPMDSLTGKLTRLDLSDVATSESIVEFLPRCFYKFTLLFANRVIGYVLLALCASFFREYIGALVTIVGSLFQSVNVIVIPCIAYTRLCPDRLQGRPVKNACMWLMAFVGMIWCIGGTVMGVMDVVIGKTS